MIVGNAYMHVFWRICNIKQLKISDPLRTLCLLLGLCVCVCVRRKLYVCRCAWQVLAGPVCQTFYLSVCLCVNECLTVDAHYKVLRVFSPGQVPLHTSVFIIHFENVAWMEEFFWIIDLRNLVVFACLHLNSILLCALLGVSGGIECWCVINLTWNVNKNMIDWINDDCE